MKYTSAGLLLLITGSAFIILGGFQGGFFIIFPFITSSSPLSALGILFLMLGGMLLFFGLATEYADYDIGPGIENSTKESRGRTLGLVMIGPVPLIIDSKNRKLTAISIAIFIAGIAILAAVFLL